MISADLLIVGAGPTGLYGAYYAGFRGLSTVVVDVLPHVGGQVLTLYPEKEIRDVAALPTIRGRDFISNLRAQADVYSPLYLLNRQVVQLDHAEGRPLTVTLNDGTQVRAGAVIISAGIGTPNPRPLVGAEEWEGRGLTYIVRDPAVYEGSDVVVVGGGDSALDWADALSTIARSVALVHRRGAFRGHASTLERVRSRGATIYTNTQVTELAGDLAAGRLERVKFRHDDGSEIERTADHVIAALGFVSELGPIRDWGLKLVGRSIAIDRSGRTNIPRVYAAGDVAHYVGRVGLLSVGFGEVATAVNHVAVDLNPELGLFPGHSTDASDPYESPIGK